MACCSAGLIAAAANSINDYFDIDIDRINRPGRPLPAGIISPQAALTTAGIEYLLGNLLAVMISSAQLAIALVFSLLTIAYSAYLKRTVLWGNLAVSITTAAAFIYGALAVGNIMAGIWPAIFAGLFHFGREILKDVQDIRGDRQYRANTLPVRHGQRPAILLVRLVFILLIFLLWYAHAAGYYGKPYLYVVVAGIYPVLAYVLISMQMNQTPARLGLLSNILKADMLVGLLAIYLG